MPTEKQTQSINFVGKRFATTLSHKAGSACESVWTNYRYFKTNVLSLSLKSLV